LSLGNWIWGHKVLENGMRVFGEAGGWNADEAPFQSLGQSTGLQFPKSGSEGKGEDGGLANEVPWMDAVGKAGYSTQDARSRPSGL